MVMLREDVSLFIDMPVVRGFSIRKFFLFILCPDYQVKTQVSMFCAAVACAYSHL